MKASTKRAFSLLLASAFFVGTLFVYAFFIKPSYDGVILLRSMVVGKQQILEDQGQVIKKVNALIQQYQGAGSLQNVISLSLPTNEDVASILGQLYGIARFNGMTMEVFGIRPLPIKPAKDDDNGLVRGLGTLRLSLRLVGDYQSIKGFVRGLETNIRVMDLVDLKIEPAAAPNEDIFLHNLIIDTYYQTK